MVIEFDLGGRSAARSKFVCSELFFINANKVSSSILIAVRDEQDTISLLVAAKDGKLPQHHLKQLKEELKARLTSLNIIENIHLSRQGRLTLTIRSIVTAQEILRLEKLFNISMSLYMHLKMF